MSLKVLSPDSSPRGTLLVGEVPEASSTSPTPRLNALWERSWAAFNLNVNWTHLDMSMSAFHQMMIWLMRTPAMIGPTILVGTKVWLAKEEMSIFLTVRFWIAQAKGTWLHWEWRYTLSQNCFGTSTGVGRGSLTQNKSVRKSWLPSKSLKNFICQL